MTWQDVYNANHVNDAFYKFSDIFRRHFDSCFPKIVLRKSKFNNINHMWITPAIEKSCKTKGKLYKRYIRNRTNENYEAYKCFRNRLTSVIRLAKK